MSKKLSKESWIKCINAMPIFGIDLVIFVNKSQVLMGRRINNPAKGKFFVPGGRVYKNETIKSAFKRILLNETTIEYDYDKSISLGLFEHFYNINYSSDTNAKTHYIIEARLLELPPEIKESGINICEQHSTLEWIDINNYKSYDIHHYSKLYINKLRDIVYNFKD